jgi:hypothetical protein
MLNKSKSNSTINEDVRNESAFHDEIQISGNNLKDSNMINLNNTSEKKKDENNFIKGMTGLTLDSNKR